MANLDEMERERARYYEALRQNQMAREDDNRKRALLEKQEKAFLEKAREIEANIKKMRKATGKNKARLRNNVNEQKRDLKAIRYRMIEGYAPDKAVAEQASRLREMRLDVERNKPKMQEQNIYKAKVNKMLEEIKTGQKSIGEAMLDARTSIQIRKLDGSTSRRFDEYLKENHPKIAEKFLAEEKEERNRQAKKYSQRIEEESQKSKSKIEAEKMMEKIKQKQQQQGHER